jgi:pyruvate dehydrogenase E2 component (dihydrolipoamide acetyltransferase)
MTIISIKRYDMPIKILMPALSPTMTAGNLAKWSKKEGDKIKAGDVIAEIETDKATMEVEAVDEGILAKILIKEATENVPINTIIAVLLEEGEDAKKLDEFIASIGVAPAATATAKPIEEVKQAPKAVAIVEQKATDRVFASPLAKRIAEQKGVNLHNISGSGPHGRIVKSDILEAGSCHRNTPSVGRNLEEYILKPHTNIRKIIAKRLVESKQEIPHFYLNIECNIDRLLDARQDINHVAGTPPVYKLSVNDMVIKAVALALRDVPAANASWDDSGVMIYNNIDVSVAVAIDDGLITPVVRNADQKSLPNISNEMKSLAGKAKENKLKPEEFQGGGFTISNLGMYGIRRFNAIINPPQSCILAVGEGSKRPIVEDDKITIATIMDVSLSCDHRVVDGAVAAKFLAAFKEYIEHPVRMLL